jgi:hypothetical protein
MAAQKHTLAHARSGEPLLGCAENTFIAKSTNTAMHGTCSRNNNYSYATAPQAAAPAYLEIGQPLNRATYSPVRTLAEGTRSPSRLRLLCAAATITCTCTTIIPPRTARTCTIGSLKNFDHPLMSSTFTGTSKFLQFAIQNHETKSHVQRGGAPNHPDERLTAHMLQVILQRSGNIHCLHRLRDARRIRARTTASTIYMQSLAVGARTAAGCSHRCRELQVLLPRPVHVLARVHALHAKRGDTRQTAAVVSRNTSANTMWSTPMRPTRAVSRSNTMRIVTFS